MQDFFISIYKSTYRDLSEEPFFYYDYEKINKNKSFIIEVN